MKILIGWEDTEQVDLMTMYLGAGDNDITIATSKEHFSASLLSIKDLSAVSYTHLTLPTIYSV